MIQVEGLGKRFGERWALRDASFGVPQGECLGVLGRNGAGKTTLVRLLTGQMVATEGQARLLGLPVAERPLELRRRTGVMPEPQACWMGSRARNTCISWDGSTAWRPA